MALRRGRRAWARILGLALAGLVHLGLFAALILPKPPQAKSSAPAGDGQQGIAVTLVRFSNSTQAAAPQTEMQRLEKLRVQLSGDVSLDSPPEPPRPPSDPAALLRAFDQARQGAALKADNTRTAKIAAAGIASALDDPMAQASVPSAAARKAPHPDLWPQLARCWRPAPAFPLVKLTVTLDDHGALVEPPSVVRDPTQTPDRARLQAEGEAIRAVIACAPYPMAGNTARSVELEFGQRIAGAG
jgi:hypothetical protein